MTTSSLENFMPLSKIGEGSFSSVYKVRRASDQEVYALKKIKMACLKEKERANALNQVRLLASLESPHIITYKQAFFDDHLGLLCIVMEYAREGDLLGLIAQHKSSRQMIPQSTIWKAACHILLGLRTLHRNNILHRDLKSANVFIGGGVFKLGDLNVSKVIGNRMVRTQTGTPFYASPQIWRDEPYDSKSDIWSFGCILYEMCTYHPPFNGTDLDELYRNVQRGIIEPLSSFYSKDLQKFIFDCLRHDPKFRPNAQQLLNLNGILITKCDYYSIEIGETTQQQKNQLLSTIHMPKDMKDLKHSLPDSKYQSKIQSSPPKPSIPFPSSKPKIIEMKPRTQPSTRIDKSIESEKQKPIPLPQRIKEHLKNINRLQQQKIASHARRLHSSKHRINSSILQEQKSVIARKIEDYLTPLKQQPLKKQRPFSCNQYLPRPELSRQSKLIPIARPQTSNPISYNSDRKAPLFKSPADPRITSDRKDIVGEIKKKYDRYYLESAKESSLKDKTRCRSANFQGRDSCAFSELRKRLEARYGNVRGGLLEKYNGSAIDRLKEQLVQGRSLAVAGTRASSGVLGVRQMGQKLKEGGYLAQIQNRLVQRGWQSRCESGMRRIIKGSGVRQIQKRI